MNYFCLNANLLFNVAIKSPIMLPPTLLLAKLNLTEHCTLHEYLLCKFLDERKNPQVNALKSKREFLTFNFRQIVVFWHPLRLFQFPLTWELFSFKILNVVLQYYYSSVKNDFWILGISNFHSAHTDSSMYFVVSILYPLCSCMRFHCVCFSDLTVIHILYHSSFDVSLPNFIVPLFNYSARSCSPWFCRLLISQGRKYSNSIWDQSQLQKLGLFRHKNKL